MKQREDYVKKAAVLRHELEQLRNQKQDLMSDGTTDRDLELILRENDKLQVMYKIEFLVKFCLKICKGR